MTRLETIYDIKGMLRGGAGSITDDDLIPDRQIALWVSSTLALLLRREQNEGKPINPVSLQHICVDVQLADTSECPECIKSGCLLYKTKVTIPSPLMTNNGLLITRIGSPFLNQPGYDKADWGRFPYINNNYNTTWYSIKDNYVYIKTTKYLKCILISFIPENIEDLATFNNVLGNPCIYDDMTSPVPMHLYEELCSIIIKNRASVTLRTNPDSTGNSNGEIHSLNGKVKTQKS